MATKTETLYPSLQKEWVVYQPAVELYPVQHNRETLANWTQWLKDPDVHLWMTGDLPDSPEKVNQWLYNATHDERRHYFAIYADGNMIGIVNLRQDQLPCSTAEIGIVIGDPMLRSRRIGTETVKQIEELAPNAYGITKIRAHIHPDNEKSLRLFTGQGFVYTGEATINNIKMMRFEKQL